MEKLDRSALAEALVRSEAVPHRFAADKAVSVVMDTLRDAMLQGRVIELRGVMHGCVHERSVSTVFFKGRVKTYRLKPSAQIRV